LCYPSKGKQVARDNVQKVFSICFLARVARWICHVPSDEAIGKTA